MPSYSAFPAPNPGVELWSPFLIFMPPMLHETRVVHHQNNWSYHATPAPVLEFGCRVIFLFCLGFKQCFHVFSRATCEPRGHFSSGTLIRFTTLSYATSPFVRTVLRCEFTLLFGRNISGIFSFSTPPASPRFLLRSGRRDMPFLRTTASTLCVFFAGSGMFAWL